MSVYGDKAEQLFRSGYNCAQSVLCAFEDVTGLDRKTSAMLASSFGGGLGRLREVCGAVSGAAMVLGLMRGYSDPEGQEAKTAHYHLVQSFAENFRRDNGSIICRELLKGVQTAGGLDPETRSAQYYKKRPCPSLCRDAAELVAKILEL